MKEHGLPVSVQSCFWGDQVGAKLQAGGQSIPSYQQAGGESPTEAEERMALWSVLYTDPWYELRLLRNMPDSGPDPFGEEAPSELVKQAVQDFEPSGDLTALLAAAGLNEYFQEALEALRDAPELQQAAATAPADPLEHRGAIARAIVAHALIAAEDKGSAPLDGEARDEIVLLLTNELHGFGLSVGGFLAAPFVGIAERMLTWKLTKDRGSITDGVSPAAGDVMRYLAQGDGARAYIRQSIADAEPGPVHILAHSLGGIMCVDLLVKENTPSVANLITVGSQSPFLYEIGALPSLEFGKELPAHFPRWHNFFDRRDLLSYIGAGVFKGRVVDIEVNNNQSFPRSHSAYWSNNRFWTALRKVLE